jgi:hypothetical protein
VGVICGGLLDLFSGLLGTEALASFTQASTAGSDLLARTQALTAALRLHRDLAPGTDSITTRGSNDGHRGFPRASDRHRGGPPACVAGRRGDPPGARVRR